MTRSAAGASGAELLAWFEKHPPEVMYPGITFAAFDVYGLVEYARQTGYEEGSPIEPGSRPWINRWVCPGGLDKITEIWPT